ncbi:MAG: hypothetical protein DI556_02105 [Rhodovulum sulfidophilum]|uniref:Uncharacterized protein n=1 Tax=Rhodovulum sulfidophilum TaxID=35806 RepID=A0A2W5NIX7_RHOSU|nr:MAG: hypothetical protein DI556_02105 [Rhodovulum sulfidophilum]
MIGAVIKAVLGNLPVLLFAAAFLAAGFRPGPGPFAERLLSWLLLLSVGAQGIWAGFFHVFFPGIAAASIGWQASPFQTEIGIADASIGVAAVVSFWRGLDFKAAVVWTITLFNVGVAIVHLRDALLGDTSVNNFGPLLGITIALAVLLPWLLTRVRGHRLG